MVTAKKSETVSLRMDGQTRALIADAADKAGKSLTAYMTEAAQAAAERELLDRRFFNLDARVFDAVTDVIDAPAQPNEALRALLRRRQG